MGDALALVQLATIDLVMGTRPNLFLLLRKAASGHPLESGVGSFVSESGR